VSRAPSPNSGVTSVGETLPASWESITPPSLLILVHSPLPLGSLLLRRLARSERPCRLSPVPAAHGSFPTLFLRICPWMLDPIPRRYTVCSRLLLRRCHRPSPWKNWVGYSRLSHERLLAGLVFRGCRYFVMFRPPSLLAPLVVPTAANTAAGQLGLLRPGLSCFVAAARTGYANRLNTGN
jgi:hypothetical protein